MFSEYLLSAYPMHSTVGTMLGSKAFQGIYNKGKAIKYTNTHK